MRLKNKKTGEMGDLIIDKALLVVRTGTAWLHYSSLAELNEEWCDYEEPKEYWYINEFGTPTKADFVGRETLYDKCRKNFGNYFETEEDAKEAVEKLKAFANLRKRGGEE